MHEFLFRRKFNSRKFQFKHWENHLLEFIKTHFDEMVNFFNAIGNIDRIKILQHLAQQDHHRNVTTPHHRHPSTRSYYRLRPSSR